MTRIFLVAVSLCLLIVIGCAKTGSTSTERTQNGSTAAPAGDTASVATSKPPVWERVKVSDIPIPDAPDPSPTDWNQFNAFFDQLMSVYGPVLKGNTPESEIAELAKKAKALAADESKERQQSMPIRQMLVTQVDELTHMRSGVLNADRLEALRRVVMSTGEIVQGSVPSIDRGHHAKIQNMEANLMKKIMEERNPGKK